MSAEFKLDVVNSHGIEESELISSTNGEVTLNDRVNATYKAFNDIRKQGNGSITNIVTNAERRAFTDREGFLFLSSLPVSFSYLCWNK
jgi:hypothetical protein